MLRPVWVTIEVSPQPEAAASIAHIATDRNPLSADPLFELAHLVPELCDLRRITSRVEAADLFRAAIFRRVLNNARLGVKNRENMRFARTRIYGLLRELLREEREKRAAGSSHRS